MRDDPPDEHDAVEIRVNGQWFAWDEDNNVYQHCDGGKNTERDDGFNLIGKLEPLDEPEYHWRSHFRQWVLDYMQDREGKHWRTDADGCYCTVCLAPVKEDLFIKRDGACPSCNPGDEPVYM